MLEFSRMQVRLLIGSGDAGLAKQMSMRTTVAEPRDRVGCDTLISDTSSGRFKPQATRDQGGIAEKVRLWTVHSDGDWNPVGVGECDLFRVSKTLGTAVLTAILPGHVRP
jgi:hypothetical protein